MTDWSRVQRMDLELRQQRANVDQLSQEVERLRAVVHDVTAQRDLARRVAIRLEQENHDLARDQVCALCSQAVVVVDDWGVAR